MAVGRILIDNVDRSKWIDFSSVVIESSATVKGSSLSFSMSIPNHEIANPEAGNTIKAEVYADTDWDFATHSPNPGAEPSQIEFGGVITEITRRILAPSDTFIYECECRDWTLWLDRKLVTTAIPYGVPIPYAVMLILLDVCQDPDAIAYYGLPAAGMNYAQNSFFSLYTPEFPRMWTTMMKLNSMDAIPRSAYSFVRASDLFNDMCESTGFQWYVDPLRQIVFYDKDLGLSSPVGDTIYEISALETDPEKIAIYSDLEVTDDISEVRNVFWFADLIVPSDDRRVIVTKEKEDAEWWQKILLFFLKYGTIFYWIWPAYRDYVLAIEDYFYVPKTYTVTEIEKTIRLWVVDLDAFTDSNNPAFEDIDESKVSEITNFEIVEKGFDLDYLMSQSNTAYFCLETREIILTTDLVDWDTQGVYITGPGVSVDHVAVSEFPGIEEMQRREHSNGIYEEYLNAADFPLNWSTAEIFERLAARVGYPRYEGSMVSMVPGWSPGQRFKFIGKTIWQMELDFFVTGCKKTFTNDRVIRTELILSTNLYKGK